jgi:hypothetical protein
MKSTKKGKAKKSKRVHLGSEGNRTNDEINLNDDLSNDETAVHTSAGSSLEGDFSLYKDDAGGVDASHTMNPVGSSGNRKVVSLHDGTQEPPHPTSQRNLLRSTKLLPTQHHGDTIMPHDDKLEANPSRSSNGLGHVEDHPNATLDENGVHGYQRKSSIRLKAISNENLTDDKILSDDALNNSGRKRKRAQEGNPADKLDRIEAPLFTYSGEQDGKEILGEDGNLFNCHICNDVGDVVCCDGCPNVYHAACIPINCESRLSLDRNDDPWYCPDCMDKNKANTLLKDGEPNITFDKYRRSPRLKKDQDTLSAGINGIKVHPPNISSLRARPLKERKEINDSDQDSDQISSNDDHSAYLEQLKSSPYLPITSIKATSPFHLYIIHNRAAIERNLFKRNKEFKRAKKGIDRNQLIAKEASKRWRRANILERKKYIDFSMEEFEQKIILWKEDQVIREMMGLLDSPNSINNANDSSSMNQEENLDTINESSKSLQNESQYWENRRNHHLSLSRLDMVPIKSGSTQNFVLLQLLRDQRFQSIQLISPSRSDSSFYDDEKTSVSMPHVAIQGPTSTNIGDVCAGCTRGWNHFCPILKTVIPAVDLRAKMQPPVNTLMLTRIGAGNFIPTTNMHDHDNQDYNQFEKDSASTLDHASNRYDETTSFINTVALASLDHHDSSSETSERKPFMCSSCRIMSESPYGCVPCRRTKLVKVMSRSGVSTIGSNEANLESDDRWSVQAKMLNHSDLKLNSFKNQHAGQAAFAITTMAKLWKPNAVMPDLHSERMDKLWKSNEVTPRHQPEMISSNKASTNLNPKIPVDEDDVSAGIVKNVRASNRLKANQSKGEGTTTTEIKPDECQYLAVEHRDEAVALQRHCLSVAILGILSGLIRRDPLGLFAKPVPDTVESYRAIVSEPIDFSNIRSKALECKYPSLSAFITDVRRLCDNALAYNLPGSIYAITAHELQDSIDEMQSRAIKWMNAIRIAHAAHFNRRGRQNNGGSNEGCNIYLGDLSVALDRDLSSKLRGSWPGAVEILENSEWLRSFIASNTFRTKENECALYGSIAIRRAAKASEVSRSATAGLNDLYNPCIVRNHVDDEELRSYIDSSLSTVIDFPSPFDISTWRENQVLRILKSVQDRRLDEFSVSTSGCARCDELQYDEEGFVVKSWNRVLNKKRMTEPMAGRVDRTRIGVNAYPSCRNTSEFSSSAADPESVESYDEDKYQFLSVRGSRIHGWGLFAEKCFKKGEVVAEYIGEWIRNGGTLLCRPVVYFFDSCPLILVWVHTQLQTQENFNITGSVFKITSFVSALS